jgi:hypothetical protein
MNTFITDEQHYRGYILTLTGLCVVIRDLQDHQYVKAVPGGFEDAVEWVDGWLDGYKDAG